MTATTDTPLIPGTAGQTMPERTMQEHFARWLVAEGLAEEHPGYGHATGDQIAERVFTYFNVWFKEPPGNGSEATL